MTVKCFKIILRNLLYDVDFGMSLCSSLKKQIIFFCIVLYCIIFVYNNLENCTILQFRSILRSVWINKLIN